MSNPKTIVVTGGAGFIGSHLCERLVKDGHRVISLDNYFTGSKDNHVAGVEYREGHTKDIAKHIYENPDILFHLGEYARVEQSVLEPEVVHNLNTHGTQGVISFWENKKCKLVYAGSSTKFGDGGKTRDASPYAKTKAENSELVREIGEREKLPYAITYFYNVYGPRERTGVYGTLIELFKDMYRRGVPITVVSPGTQKRNFTHVHDIVDGLMLVGEKGIGDEFGFGNTSGYTILEVAEMFTSDVIMMPERKGNRMHTDLDTTKAKALGWEAKRSLKEYIQNFTNEYPRGEEVERRILVFTTTFYPIAGPAEEALCEVMRHMPSVHFDILTTRFHPSTNGVGCPVLNASVHRLGFGSRLDKYMLPILAAYKARQLQQKHSYIFSWALMASYAALGAVLLKRFSYLPLLVTLADQNFADITGIKKLFLRTALTGADQIYGIHARQENDARDIAQGKDLRSSIGRGDSFANAVRFAYASIFKGIAK